MKLFWMRLLIPAVSRFPWFFYPLAFPVGLATWQLRPSIRRNLTRNLLPLCDGNRRRARRSAVEVLRNVGLYWVDLASLSRRDLNRFEREHLAIEHAERLEILGRKGPLLIVSAHTGNPELVVQALTRPDRPYLALVEALRSPGIARYMRNLRGSSRARLVEADFRGIRAAVEALREGGVVGVLADRDIQGTGICTTLLGRKVRLPAGPWELARRTGATVLPVFASRRSVQDHAVTVGEPFCVPATPAQRGDIEIAVHRWAGMLEQHLQRVPGQWTVLEDFWKVHGCE